MAERCHALDHDRVVEAVAGEVERFVGLVKEADLTRPVPTCPGWTVARLVRHLGHVHRWATRLVSERAPRRIDPREVELGLPAEESGYPEWMAGGAGSLVETLRAVEPDTPMWAWGADQHARFWSRRMLHETTVHRADAELALGREPSVDREVAIDGVDELLENLPHAVPIAPKVAELRGEGETIRLECGDADVGWSIRLQPDGYTWDHRPMEADATVRGAAADLLLLAYGRYRRDDDRFELRGDAELLDHWIANSAL